MLVTKALALTGVKVIMDNELFKEVSVFAVIRCNHLDISVAGQEGFQ